MNIQGVHTQTVLSQSSYHLLLHIKSISAKERFADVSPFSHFRHMADTDQFKPIPLCDLIGSDIFAYRPPAENISEFHDAMQELTRKHCIKIEGNGWWAWLRRKSTVGRTSKLLNEFLSTQTAAASSELDVELNRYMRRHDPQLAEAKIYITNRGVRLCNRNRRVPSPDPDCPFQS